MNKSLSSDKNFRPGDGNIIETKQWNKRNSSQQKKGEYSSHEANLLAKMTLGASRGVFQCKNIISKDSQCIINNEVPRELQTRLQESLPIKANMSSKIKKKPVSLILKPPRLDVPVNILQNDSKAKKKTQNSISEINTASAQKLAAASHPSNLMTNIRVYVRFRPLKDIEQELIQNGIGTLCTEFPSDDQHLVSIKRDTAIQATQFVFDHVFPCEATQDDVYKAIGVEMIGDITTGYNGTIFAYGQTGSGKTHTMYGDEIFDKYTRGLIPRMVEQLFDYVSKCEENVTFQFKVSVLQIYKEVVYDLLTGEKDLKIKENPVRGIYVDGISEVYVNTLDNFLDYVDLSQANRIVSETKMNQFSSRSHSILILEVTQTYGNENITKKGTLNLVDLAGSEQVSKTGSVGETLEEAKKINLSLSALGNVIHALNIGSDHIPYRDSKLTRLLQESLGGNFKTSLIVTCSPHSYHIDHTLSSLKFAQRAKFIMNKYKINIKLSYEELQRMVYTLRSDLETANNQIASLRSITPKSALNEATLEANKPTVTSISVEQKEPDSCSMHNEIIKRLSLQLEEARNEIHEKDEIIRRLEEEIRKLKENNKTRTKLSGEEEVIEDKANDFQKRKEDLNEDIKEKIELIKRLQLECKEINERRCALSEQNITKMDHLHEIMIGSFVNANTNANNDITSSSADNTATALIENVNNLIKNSFASIKSGKSPSQDYFTITEIISKLCDSKPTNNEKLNEFSLRLLLELLYSCFNLQLKHQITSSLSNENQILKDIITVLMNLSEGNLRSLFELSQNHSNLINQSELLKTSMYPEGKNEITSYMRKLTMSVNKKSSNILALVSRKNLSGFKNLKEQNGMKSSGRSFLNLISCNQSEFTLGSPLCTKDLHSSSKTNDLCSSRVFLTSPNPKVETAAHWEVFPFRKNETEKKLSELDLLREYVVKAVTESESNKRVVDQVRKDFNNITSAFLERFHRAKGGRANEVDKANEDERSSEQRKSVDSESQENVIREIEIQKDIETIIADYVETGVATRKFDGISVKIENNHVKCIYQGGLNANNHLPSIPLKEHLPGSCGDDPPQSVRSMMNEL